MMSARVAERGEREGLELSVELFVGQRLTWYPVLVEWKTVMRCRMATHSAGSILKHNKPCIVSQPEAHRY